jgi:mannan endo-1,4-beta-mannosidase
MDNCSGWTSASQKGDKHHPDPEQLGLVMQPCTDYHADLTLLRYLIDAITLKLANKRGPHQITTTPVNKNANNDAKALLKYLGNIYGEKILSGQQDQASLDWVTQNVGTTPAILGLDLMDYTESRKSRGASSTDVDKAIAFAKKGGIVTFCWHWGAPTGLYDTSAQPWYRGFYTDATDFNIETALANTNNANYTLLMKDIDTIAVQLKKLQDAGVPVIWRPLHEAEGGWFWWGAKGPEPAKKLWKIVYDRLTNQHKLNNLIWTWNSVAPSWYPGSDTVDIVSADTYAEGDHGVRLKNALKCGLTFANVSLAHFCNLQQSPCPDKRH